MLKSNNVSQDYKDFLIRSKLETEKALARINQKIEELDKVSSMGIEETIKQFIREKCIVDPVKCEDANRLYDAFDLFKTTHGITTKILKRSFFAELDYLGFSRFKGMLQDQPNNAVNGLCLVQRLPGEGEPGQKPEDPFRGPNNDQVEGPRKDKKYFEF